MGNITIKSRQYKDFVEVYVYEDLTEISRICYYDTPAIEAVQRVATLLPIYYERYSKLKKIFEW